MDFIPIVSDVGAGNANLEGKCVLQEGIECRNPITVAGEQNGKNVEKNTRKKQKLSRRDRRILEKKKIKAKGLGKVVLEKKMEKWRQMDEKKQNRLFLKFKKNIRSETDVKVLHPNILEVIFPRKKKSRWCWAVFESKEQAELALKEMISNPDVFVDRPKPYAQVVKRNIIKMKRLKRKKEAVNTMKQMWS